MESIKIKTEYITLQQFLKIIDMISSGGQAKYYLVKNLVLVNDEPESRRGRKLYPHDIVLVKGKRYEIL